MTNEEDKLVVDGTAQQPTPSELIEQLNALEAQRPQLIEKLRQRRACFLTKVAEEIAHIDADLKALGAKRTRKRKTQPATETVPGDPAQPVRTRAKKK